MPYKAGQSLKCGNKTYASGETVPGAENFKNLFDLLRTNYLYYADEKPQVKEPQEEPLAEREEVKEPELPEEPEKVKEPEQPKEKKPPKK